jgi:hypothetical protein
VRQLAAAAGDGWLGSVGSPGQLETSLNSGYTVGPCNSYLEGPTPIYLGLLLAQCLIARSAREAGACEPRDPYDFAGFVANLVRPGAHWATIGRLIRRSVRPRR